MGRALNERENQQVRLNESHSEGEGATRSSGSHMRRGTNRVIAAERVGEVCTRMISSSARQRILRWCGGAQS
jgi:hypothetical protein